MCTVIVYHDPGAFISLVVAANRDEYLNRPSETPAMRDEEFGILAPRDVKRGGSWIGINKFGVLVALTNRIDVPARRGRISRGAVVMQTLRHRSAQQSFEYAQTFHPTDVSEFHLVVTDAKDLFLLKSDGEKFEPSHEAPGLLVVSNHGCGRLDAPGDSRRVGNVLRYWQANYPNGAPQTHERLAELLDIHDDDRYGTCVFDPANDYGTKSSSIIVRVNGTHGPMWRYFHRERTDNTRRICYFPFNAPMTLPITTPPTR